MVFTGFSNSTMQLTTTRPQYLKKGRIGPELANTKLHGTWQIVKCSFIIFCRWWFAKLVINILMLNGHKSKNLKGKAHATHFLAFVSYCITFEKNFRKDWRIVLTRQLSLHLRKNHQKRSSNVWFYNTPLQTGIKFHGEKELNASSLTALKLIF